MDRNNHFNIELDGHGHEVVDPEPMAVPAGFKKPETLSQTVARLLRKASDEAAEAGGETMEEADDFDIDDEFDPSTPYEMFFDSDLGREINAQDMQNPALVERFRNEALVRMRNHYRRMEEEFAVRPRERSVAPTTEKGVQGASPAPSSEKTP